MSAIGNHGGEGTFVRWWWVGGPAVLLGEVLTGRLRLEPKRASGTGELPSRWWNMGIIVGSHCVVRSICR